MSGAVEDDSSDNPVFAPPARAAADENGDPGIPKKKSSFRQPSEGIRKKSAHFDEEPDDKPVQVSISAEAHRLLSSLRRPGESDHQVLSRSLEYLDAYTLAGTFGAPHDVSLSVSDYRKCGIASKQMRRAGYSQKKVTAVCRALFGSQTDEEMKDAFDYFDLDRNGTIEIKEMKAALPLMGDDVPDDRIKELFEVVDIDNDKTLQFPEFCELVKGMNPKDGEDGLGFGVARTLTTFRSGAAAAVQANLPSMDNIASETHETFAAVSSAWSAGLGANAPAGHAINTLKASNYSEDQAISLCKAFFDSGRTEEDMRAAFTAFANGRPRRINKDDMMKCFVVMVQETDGMQPGEVTKMFKATEGDQLEFAEFKYLMITISPFKDGGEGWGDSVAGAWGSMTSGLW